MEDNFDAIKSPLEGTILIQASAGTGKTYTITSLYLRFIIEKGLDVHQILVVTFTEAATAELRSRIRKRLTDAMRAVAGEKTSDIFLSEYLASLQGKFHQDDIRSSLEMALRSFDKASIYTIHGFCNRILSDQPFMSGSVLGEELITEPYELFETVSKDFIRIHLTSMSPLFLEWSRKELKIKDLMSLVKPIISNKNIKIFQDILYKPDCEQAEKLFMESFKKLSKIWDSNQTHVKDILCNHDKNLDGRVYNQKSAEKIIMEIDRYCLSECSLPPDVLEKKCMSSCISRYTKENAPVAENPFFAWCESHIVLWKNLESIYDRTALWLKKEFISFISERFKSEKNKRNLKTFDDLLSRVNNMSNIKKFAKAISDRYPVAVVDEFQDTDEIQWNILKNIFQDNSKSLFLIGDPKQAIYGFRGADIFSYLLAAKSADNIFTLRENWRSEPRLISAINALFSSHKNPFINDDIHFIPAKPAKPAADHEEHISSDNKTSPFEFWFADNTKNEHGKDINKSDAADIILEKMGNEIVHLLNMGKEGRITISGNPLKENHMAVLIRSHNEAQQVLDSLEKINIKGVIYGTESVFNSCEATELELILNAVARPNNMHAFTAAMGTELMGVPGAHLINFEKNQSCFEKKLKAFSEYKEQWAAHGFISMFSNLVSEEKILTRLAGLSHGERRLTNLRHLMELLHNAETEERLNTDGLINWLSERRENIQNSDSEQLRLESDENAILIITMHKSKGLEFPVVFIPFPWSCTVPSSAKEPYILFHKNNFLYLDMGSEEIEENRMISRDEALAENVRLFYVALTRAKNRCYTAWGKIGDKNLISAPAWLFHNKDFNTEETSPSQSTEKKIKALTSEDIYKELKIFENDSSHAISVSYARPAETQPLIKTNEITKQLSVRSLNKKIDTSWRISSFSSMSKKSDSSENQAQDYDTFIEKKTEDIEPQAKVEKSVFSMPKGAVTGNIFHEILESYDFTETNKKILPDLVEKKCMQYGYGKEWNSIITETVCRVLSAPLCTDNPAITLSKIGRKDRISELSFYFPIEKLNVEHLKKAMLSDVSLPSAFKKDMENFSFVPGFMKGYIDLIFRINGKFYMVDWKSNHLGNAPEDYNDNAIIDVMAKEQYFLQYYIYTIALDKYLSRRIRDYDYRTCFGGVFYIFLRGVGHNTSLFPHGIFSNKPSYDAIKALSLCF